MLNETLLISSGHEFKAYEPSEKYYVDSREILLNKEDIKIK